MAISKNKAFSVTKFVGIIGFFLSIHLKYDVGVWASMGLMLGKLLKPILLAWKGIDDDQHK